MSTEENSIDYQQPNNDEEEYKEQKDNLYKILRKVATDNCFEVTKFSFKPDDEGQFICNATFEGNNFTINSRFKSSGLVIKSIDVYNDNWSNKKDLSSLSKEFKNVYYLFDALKRNFDLPKGLKYLT